MKKIILIFIAIILLGGQLWAQTKFSQQVLKDDLTQFFDIIENSHPDPYSGFGGKMQFHKQAQQIKNAIPEEGLSKTDFQNLLSVFLAKIRDGHTYIVENELEPHSEATQLLNIQFKILTDGLIVSRSENSGLNGKKLLSVNGVEVEELLKHVQLLKPCENTYGAYYELLDILCNSNKVKQLFPDFNLNNNINLALLDDKGNVVNHSVKFLDINKRKLSSEKEWSKTKPKQAPFWYDFIDDSKKIAYFPFYTTYSREVIEMQKLWNSDYNSVMNMLYNNFNLGKVPKDYNEAIKKIPSINETFYDMLSEMKKNKSSHLIIDLRQNGGGWTPITLPTLYMLTGDKYFGHKFTEEYNTLISKLYLKKNNQTIEEFNKQRQRNYKIGDYVFSYFMGSGWSDEMPLKDRRIKYFSDNIAGNNNGDKISGINRLINNSTGEPIYQPKIIVVCSPTTFSAAFHYMYFLQTICGATVVGVTPRQAYNNGMEVTPFSLDNTKIQGSVSNSYQLFCPQDMEQGRELIPDYLFKWSDYMKYDGNKDAEIMYVLDMIKADKF